MRVGLDGFALLEELTAEERDQLHDFLEVRSYQDGGLLFYEREEAAELILIVEGGVRLECGGDLLGKTGEGAALGGISLIRIGERACSALAAGPVEAMVLSRESYLRLRGDHPHVALALQEGILRSVALLAQRAFPLAS